MQKKLGFAFLLVLLTLVWGTPGAAQDAEPDTLEPAAACDPADQFEITATLNEDGSEATFTVLNAQPLCEPVEIGHAVYLKDADQFVTPQSLFDSATDTITTGSKVLTVDLPQESTHPTCWTQIDAFVGPVLPEITDTQQYLTRLRDFLFGSVPDCAEIDAQSTTTTESTATTVKSLTATRSDPPAPAIVDPAVQVEGVALARTGPAQELSGLLAAAGILLVLGGGAVAFAVRRST